MRGMAKNGYDEDFAARCFSQIEGFGSYGFPESHAASFALLVYASAWIKCHHPGIFACALLNSQPMGFYAPAQIVRDAREHGVEVRPVCVNSSYWDNTMEPDGRGGLARAYEQTYLEHAGELDGPALLPLYRAYRAQVRAMVDEQACRGAEIDDATKAAKAQGALRTLGLAWSQARIGAPQPLIVLRGAAGTGKSWLSSRLAPWLGAQVIRSDVVRKELLGAEATWRPDADEKGEVYGAEMHARTYAAVLQRARDCVEAGYAAFLDATYLRRASRDEVREAARALGVPFLILDITCEPEVVRERLIQRALRDDDASDADQDIYEAMMRTAEPITDEERPFTVSFASGRPAEEAVLPLVAAIEAQVDARTEPLGPDPKPWRPDA